MVTPTQRMREKARARRSTVDQDPIVVDEEVDHGRPVAGLIGGGPELRRQREVPRPFGPSPQRPGPARMAQDGPAPAPPGHALRRSAGGSGPGPSSGVTPTVLRRDGTNTLGSGTGTVKGKVVDQQTVQSTSDPWQKPGTVTTTTRGTKAGAWSSHETSTDTFDGTTAKKGQAGVSGLAGAEAYLKTIKKATDEELSLAFEAVARAGAFGKAGASGSISRGIAETGGEANVEGGVGVEARSGGSVSVDKTGVIPDVQVALMALIKLGVDFKVSAMGYAKLGPAEIRAAIEGSVFAGAKAGAEGKLRANLHGVSGQGKAYAMAGAEAKGKTTVTAKLSEQEVSGAISGEAFAGAKAGAKGKFSIGLTGVEVSGEAEAIAGASAKATGEIAWTHRGRKIFAAKGTVTVYAGIGGKVKGKFVFRNGKLSLNFGGAAVFGIGAGTDIAAELDFIALSGAIYSEIANAINRRTVEISEHAGKIDRQPVVDRLVAATLIQKGYETYIGDFRAYAAKKMGEGRNGLKKERVQEILDNRRGQIGMDLVFAETDEGITKAAVEAFGPLCKKITIVGGKLEHFLPAAFTEIGGIRKSGAKDAAMTAFKKALSTKVTKQQSGGKHMPDPEMLKKVISAHYSKVSAACSPDEADTLMAAAVEEVFGGVMSGFTISGGVPGSFKFDAQAISDKDEAAAKAKEEAAAQALLDQITAACAEYAAKKAGTGAHGIKKEVLAKAIAKPAGKLVAGLDPAAKLAMDARIAQAAKAGLGPSIVDIGFVDGVITTFVPADADKIKQALIDDKAAAARESAYRAAAKKFTAYAAKKVRKGSNGIKPDEVQSIVNTVFKVVGSDTAARAEADARLTQEAADAFAATVNYVKVTDGVVVLVVSQTKTTGAKDKYRSDKARVGFDFDDGDGNKRRYHVRDQVHPRLVSYFGRIVGNPKGVPTTRGLQNIVTAATSKFRDEFAFPDAKAELVRTIAETSDGVCSVNEVGDQGELIGVAFDMTRLGQVRTKAADDAKDEVVLKALRKPLASYAKASYKKRPTLSGLQQVIDKAARSWAKVGQTPTPVDELITKAISEAFGERIKEVVVSGGLVMVLRMAA